MSDTPHANAFYAEAARDASFWATRCERLRALVRDLRRRGYTSADKRLSRALSAQAFAADALELTMVEAGWA